MDKARIALITHRDAPHLAMYLEALAKTPEVAAVHLCDPDSATVPAARQALADKLASTHATTASLFAAHRPEMALVTMEAALAPPAIDAALGAGCHVLAEKPACVRLADFLPLADKAEAGKRHLMLALANRIDPLVMEARRIARSGEIGRIYGCELQLVADQTRLARPAYHRSWTASKARAGGGHLIWLGIHWLDLAVFLTGSRIRRVAGFAANVGGQPIDTEDSASVALQFDNGTLGTLTSGYYVDRGYHSMIKLWGSAGWISVRKHPEDLLEWYTNESGKVRRYEGPREPSGYTPFVGQAVRASMGASPPPLSTGDSVHALKAVFAAYRAAETGRAQEVG
jgi:predicted dehydrogenase